MADDFGTHLRHQRELRGISLDEIASTTKIHIRYLKALENNSLDELPGEVFIKGFIRSYGRAIGANITELLDIYDETVGKERVEKRQQAVQEGQRETRKQVFLVNALVGGFLGLFFLFAVWYLVTNPPKTETPEASQQPPRVAASPAPENPGPPGTLTPEVNPESSAVGESKTELESETVFDNPEEPAEEKSADQNTKSNGPTPQAETGPAEKPVPEKENGAIIANQKAQQVQEDSATPAESAPAEAPLKLVIQVSENAWFNLAIDGSGERDFILPAGESKELKAQEEILLTIGNRRGTRLKLNGKTLELPASSDNVVRKFRVNAKLIE